MKHVWYSLLFISLFVNSCGDEETDSEKGSSSNNETTNESPDSENRGSIQGEINGADGKTLELQLFDAGQWRVIEQAEITDGSFSFPVTTSDLRVYRLRIKGGDETNQIIALASDQDAISLKADADDLSGTVSVKGSEATELFMEYQGKIMPYLPEINKTREAINNAAFEDSLQRAELLEKLNGIFDEINETRLMYIENNPDNPATYLIFQEYMDVRYQRQLFDEDDLKRLETIVEALEEKHPDGSLTGSARSTFNRVRSDVVMLEEIRKAEDNRTDLLNKGQVAPEIYMNDPEDNPIALSELRGKYVLIDFWASWCGPCRRENPNLIKTYATYKDKGFEIYSVSLDNDKNKWLSAIQQDKLEWPNHVSDLAGWRSAAARLYGINSIPFTVLVDPDGKIIATGLRGSALDQKLEEIFGA